LVVALCTAATSSGLDFSHRSIAGATWRLDAEMQPTTSTMPSNLAAASSWDPESACQFGEVIGGELRAQGFDWAPGGGVNLNGSYQPS